MLSACAIAVSLAACASPEEIHRADQRQCENFGFKSGTDAFASCMQKIAGDRKKQAEAVMAAGAAKPAAKTACKSSDKERSNTSGNSTSTTTGGLGSSTTTGSSSSETTSSGFSLTTCTDE